jgi:deoxyribose-phosphate aldolase
MTASRIEQLAAELLALTGLSAADADERIAAVIGDADRDVAQAALDLAAETIRQRTVAAAKHAAMLQTIERLAHATHCPDGTDAKGWLLELGLIERDGLGYRLTERAHPHVVRP